MPYFITSVCLEANVVTGTKNTDKRVLRETIERTQNPLFLIRGVQFIVRLVVGSGWRGTSSSHESVKLQ